ncbi:MAG: alcohol dehydrogenase [Acidobacteria bacterium RIFCSPLOWO2_12_FULL_67_14b]|nr:MAG: alcohol dehydrogenase [Acidobacteria bacterium RIFCSPLOWO2_12_FULL_67_14b]
MKAVRFHAHGGPDVLRHEEVSEPIPGPGEALVRVRACALNHLDLWQRRGMERVQIPFPHISGADVAGEVVSSPEGEFAAGRRVMLQPGISCGRCAHCLDGRDNECPTYDVLGYRSDGGYAEYVKVPVQNLIAIPDAIGFVEAAAFPLAFLTAWHMLITRAHLRAGEDVLVLGAGSGVGQAAIQIAWRHGARVFATAGTDEKLARARQLGAYEVVNHTMEDWPKRIKDFTGGRGVDVVVEHTGTATWDHSLKSLVRGGRLVTCGATTGHDARIDLRFLFGRQLSLLGSYMGRKGELLRAAPFFFAGELRSVVDRTYPLAEAAEAHRRLEARAQFGKIVLVV